MIHRQVQYEDVQVGSEIPALPKVASTAMLIKWAGASGDFNPLHYEDAYAVRQGVGGPIVHGALKRQWLIQMLTDWIGEEGTLKRFSCQYRRMDHPRKMKTVTEPEEGETWMCRGTVSAKRVHDGEHLVDCRVWVENGNGEKTTTGEATVDLPSLHEA